MRSTSEEASSARERKSIGESPQIFISKEDPPLRKKELSLPLLFAVAFLTTFSTFFMCFLAAAFSVKLE
jgi:hypothetical protein